MTEHLEIRDNEKIQEILEVIVAYARLDFEQKVIVGEKGDEIDALAAGVNMLGEELNASVLSLKEKELMLREIHHRVKNNLQIVSSLLNLQVKRESDQRLRDFARESQSRIKAISLIHEMLYQSSDFTHTNFRIYVEKLLNMLHDMFSSTDLDVECEADIPEDMFFDLDKLIPLGLIINESVSNSIKHAFLEGKGTITVRALYENNTYKVQIADNGKGLDKEFNIENDTNLGMQLIHILATQIDAELKIQNGIGLTYELKF